MGLNLTGSAVIVGRVVFIGDTPKVGVTSGKASLQEVAHDDGHSGPRLGPGEGPDLMGSWCHCFPPSEQVPGCPELACWSARWGRNVCFGDGHEEQGRCWDTVALCVLPLCPIHAL